MGICPGDFNEMNRDDIVAECREAHRKMDSAMSELAALESELTELRKQKDEARADHLKMTGEAIAIEEDRAALETEVVGLRKLVGDASVNVSIIAAFQAEGAEARRLMEKAYKAIGGGSIDAALSTTDDAKEG